MPPSVRRAKHHGKWNSIFCEWPPQRTGPGKAVGDDGDKEKGGGGNEENALRESFQKGLDYSLTGLGWEGHAESVKQNEAPPF